MKNKAFQDYATGTAFSIHLSKRQCWGLLALLDRKNDHWLYSGQFISIGKDLRARGLIEGMKKPKMSENGRYWPKHKLTKAGKLITKLLLEAGLKMENTRTLSIIKGVELWEK